MPVLSVAVYVLSLGLHRQIPGTVGALLCNLLSSSDNISFVCYVRHACIIFSHKIFCDSQGTPLRLEVTSTLIIVCGYYRSKTSTGRRIAEEGSYMATKKWSGYGFRNPFGVAIHSFRPDHGYYLGGARLAQPDTYVRPILMKF